MARNCLFYKALLIEGARLNKKKIKNIENMGKIGKIGKQHPYP